MKTMVLGVVAALALALSFSSSAEAASVRTAVVPGNTTDVWTITFAGGFKAAVAISGDGDTDLDLYVYDENRNLIASSAGPRDRESVSWTPRWTGKFTIKVVNRSRFVSNRYAIAWE